MRFIDSYLLSINNPITNISYYLYSSNNINNIYMYKIGLFKNHIIYTFRIGKLYIINHILISLNFACDDYRIIYYEPIIKIKNRNNIFNFYYRYIIMKFFIKTNKYYDITRNYNINKVMYCKKFNTMRQYKCIILTHLFRMLKN